MKMNKEHIKFEIEEKLRYAKKNELLSILNYTNQITERTERGR